MNKFFVSIVMPAFNSEKFIENSICSIFRQTYSNWELIVVDDCSSDSTCEIVSRIASSDRRVRLIRLSKNFGGPAGPRNIGIEASEFSLIAFLDSDDIWHPKKLEMQLSQIEKIENFFSCTEMQDFFNDSLIKFPVIDSAKLDHISFKSQSLRARIPTSSVVVSKSLISQFGFQESPRYKAVEDFHCWLRILESGVVCNKVRAPLLFYRRSEGQISGSKVAMMKKVFMVHKEYPGRNIFSAALLTASHVLGGIYFRLIKKGM